MRIPGRAIARKWQAYGTSRPPRRTGSGDGPLGTRKAPRAGSRAPGQIR